MPRLHGWRNDSEDPTSWTYGGRNFAAFMWVPNTKDYSGVEHPGEPTLPVEVRIWPRLGDVGTNDPTKPLGAEHGALTFPDEASARAYIESWERATG